MFVWHADGGVEAAEDLLEGVVVAFAVASGKIGVGAGGGIEQGWIVQEKLIRGVAVANPEFVGTLLIPGDGRLGATDFDPEAVFASGGNLAGGDAAAGAFARAKNYGAAVFCGYGRVEIVFRAEGFICESLGRVFGLLAGAVKSLQVGAERSDTEPGDVLGHVEPVGADIGHGARRAGAFVGPWDRSGGYDRRSFAIFCWRRGRRVPGLGRPLWRAAFRRERACPLAAPLLPWRNAGRWECRCGRRRFVGWRGCRGSRRRL